MENKDHAYSVRQRRWDVQYSVTEHVCGFEVSRVLGSLPIVYVCPLVQYTEITLKYILPVL